MARFEDIMAAKTELSSRLLRDGARRPAVAIGMARTVAEARKNAGRNLHAVGVGRKIVDGKRTRTLCVRLYVLEKITESVLPASARLPKTIDGLPTDVIEWPMASFHAAACSTNRRQRQRPITGGISAAHKLVNKSTLGCFCRSLRVGESDRRYMLGCSHAFANMNSATLTSPILQPSPGDGGGASPDGDRVARLARYVPLRFGGTRQNLVDAAIAEVARSISIRNEICTIGPLKGIAQATEGMIVRKHGRTTSYTEGEVVDPSMDGFIADYPGGAIALFTNQVRIDPTSEYDTWPAPDGGFAAPGDSGSVVVEKGSQRAVALHFAGNYGISVANPIRDVCKLLQIAIP